MKMPASDTAIVDRRKLTEYCLNPEHPRGKHKARVFATLGSLLRKLTNYEPAS